MNEITTMLTNEPQFLILEDRVYKLTISHLQHGDRYFERGLEGYEVKVTNPIDASDLWSTRLEIWKEIYNDYPNSIEEPLIWILIRFLYRHVRSIPIELLKKGSKSLTLLPTDVKDLRDSISSDDIAEDELRSVLSSWARVYSEEPVEIASLFVSTNIKLDTLKRSLKSLVIQDQITKVAPNSYRVKSSLLSGPAGDRSITLNTKYNRINAEPYEY